jgi:predicted ATP-dependent endonuclease of OLD family
MSKTGDKQKEKISLKEIMGFGKDLIDWMTTPDSNGAPSDNILYSEFCQKNNLFEDDIDYLINKYPDFYQIMKKADEIQRVKIRGFALSGMIPSIIMKDVLSEKTKIERKKDKIRVEAIDVNKIKNSIRKYLKAQKSYSKELEPIIEITAGNMLVYYMAKKDIEYLSNTFISESTREGNLKISEHPAAKTMRESTEIVRRCLRELRLTLTTFQGDSNDDMNDLIESVNSVE